MRSLYTNTGLRQLCYQTQLGELLGPLRSWAPSSAQPSPWAAFLVFPSCFAVIFQCLFYMHLLLLHKVYKSLFHQRFKKMVLWYPTVTTLNQRRKVPASFVYQSNSYISFHEKIHMLRNTSCISLTGESNITQVSTTIMATQS